MGVLKNKVDLSSLVLDCFYLQWKKYCQERFNNLINKRYGKRVPCMKAFTMRELQLKTKICRSNIICMIKNERDQTKLTL